jgi:hypothetical protein
VYLFFSGYYHLYLLLEVTSRKITLEASFVNRLLLHMYAIVCVLALASSMLGITDPKMSEWVQERLLTPHPYSTYEDPPAPSTPESPSIPRTYIHCTLGPLSSWMEPFAARARKPKWNVHAMAWNHDMMITQPN